MLKKNHGFSLIEILIASAVLGSVLVGLSLLMGLVTRSDAQARNRVIAGDLAQSGSDYFRQQRKIIGFGRLWEALSADEVYCINEINQSFLDENELIRARYKAVCDNDIEAEGTATKFMRVAEVNELTDDLISIIITVSWQTDAEKETEVSTTLLLRSQ